MNAVSEDIKDMLEAESSLGLTFGTDLFIGKEPSEPKNVATIYDYAGYPPQLTLEGEDNAYYYTTVQVRVRNTSYVAGWALIQDIANALHGRSHESWNGTLYTVIYCSGGPALLEWDNNGLVIFIVNFNLQRR